MEILPYRGYGSAHAPGLMLCRVTDAPRCIVTVESIHGRVASQPGCSQQCALINVAQLLLAHSVRCSVRKSLVKVY